MVSIKRWFASCLMFKDYVIEELERALSRFLEVVALLHIFGFWNNYSRYFV